MTKQLENQSKLVCQKKQSDLTLYVLNKHTEIRASRLHKTFIRRQTWVL
jgi:hypothetical protein